MKRIIIINTWEAERSPHERKEGEVQCDKQREEEEEGQQPHLIALLMTILYEYVSLHNINY